MFQYICDSADLHSVKKNLEENGAVVSEARLGYMPKMFIPLSAEELDILAQAIEEIESLDFIIRVYDNAEAK